MSPRSRAEYLLHVASRVARDDEIPPRFVTAESPLALYRVLSCLDLLSLSLSPRGEPDGQAHSLPRSSKSPRTRFCILSVLYEEGGVYGNRKTEMTSAKTTTSAMSIGSD